MEICSVKRNAYSTPSNEEIMKTKTNKTTWQGKQEKLKALKEIWSKITKGNSAPQQMRNHEKKNI